jgi:hypothetical protein
MRWLSNLSERDRRALSLLLLSAILFLGYRYLVPAPADTITGIDSVPAAELRLNHLRQIVAAMPAKESILKEVEAELATREKSVVTAGTAAQAQARLLEVARRVGNGNGIDIRGGDLSTAPKVFGDAYGEVFAEVTFNCQIDQFVNFFADLSHEPDLLAPHDVTVNPVGDPKAKNLAVRVLLTAVVPRKLVPEKKGYGL